MKILVINGVNLNMLGKREPEIYGSDTIEDYQLKIRTYAESCDVDVDFYQSNHEGEIVEKIHSVDELYDGVIINPGAHTHYSIALADAIASVKTAFIEVHISNIHNREEFRQKSVTASKCVGQISGFGVKSYLLAIDYFLK